MKAPRPPPPPLTGGISEQRFRLSAGRTSAESRRLMFILRNVKYFMSWEDADQPFNEADSCAPLVSPTMGPAEANAAADRL